MAQRSLVSDTIVVIGGLEIQSRSFECSWLEQDELMVSEQNASSIVAAEIVDLPLPDLRDDVGDDTTMSQLFASAVLPSSESQLKYFPTTSLETPEFSDSITPLSSPQCCHSPTKARSQGEGRNQPREGTLFQSLLFEAYGRTVNPVNGAMGLLSTGTGMFVKRRWRRCCVLELVSGSGSGDQASDEASEVVVACSGMWKLRGGENKDLIISPIGLYPVQGRQWR
ncbi:LOB domain-containing protein 38 [Linum perenne]